MTFERDTSCGMYHISGCNLQHGSAWSHVLTRFCYILKASDCDVLCILSALYFGKLILLTCVYDSKTVCVWVNHMFVFTEMCSFCHIHRLISESGKSIFNIFFRNSIFKFRRVKQPLLEIPNHVEISTVCWSFISYYVVEVGLFCDRKWYSLKTLDYIRPF